MTQSSDEFDCDGTTVICIDGQILCPIGMINVGGNCQINWDDGGDLDPCEWLDCGGGDGGGGWPPPPPPPDPADCDHDGDGSSCSEEVNKCYQDAMQDFIDCLEREGDKNSRKCAAEYDNGGVASDLWCLANRNCDELEDPFCSFLKRICRSKYISECENANAQNEVSTCIKASDQAKDRCDFLETQCNDTCKDLALNIFYAYKLKQLVANLSPTSSEEAQNLFKYKNAYLPDGLKRGVEYYLNENMLPEAYQFLIIYTVSYPVDEEIKRSITRLYNETKELGKGIDPFLEKLYQN